MDKMHVISKAVVSTTTSVAGKPTMPSPGRPLWFSRRTTDPSSAAPKGERYPIPSLFEYRVGQAESFS